jgi:hypothetical protein
MARVVGVRRCLDDGDTCMHGDAYEFAPVDPALQLGTPVGPRRRKAQA